jgi:hypothetical protein
LRIYHNDSGANANLFLQKKSIQKNYECFRCEVNNGVLTCIGIIIPECGCQQYKIKVQQRKGCSPKAWILDPIIEYDSKIHMFKDDGSLCLYDHRASAWKLSDLISMSIIPWMAEWVVLYELYQIYGEWLAPEAPH